MPFDPTSLSGLYSWLSLPLQSGLTDGAPVSALTDNSGHGRGLTFASAKPIYHLSVPQGSGRPALYFPGTSVIQDSWVTLATSPYHVWAVIAPDLAGHIGGGWNWAVVGNSFTWTLCDFTGGWGLYVNFNEMGNTPFGDPPYVVGSVHLIEGWCDGVNTHIAVDGVDVTSNATNGVTQAPGLLKVANYDAGNHPYSGYVMELGARTATRSSGDGVNLVAYFNEVYRPSTALSVSMASGGGSLGGGVVATVSVNNGTTDGSGSTLATTLTDGAGGSFSPSSFNLSPTTLSGTSTYQPATTGWHTITATAGSLTGVGHYVVSGSTPVTVAVTDAGFLWSPYNWYHGSGYMLTTNPGAYFRTQFEGTSVGLAVDVSPMVAASYAAQDYPQIAWSINGSTWQTHLLTSGDTTVHLGSGTAGKLNSLELIYEGLNATDLGGQDVWTTPSLCVKVTGLVVDEGCGLAAPTRRAKNMVVYGDSIACGCNSLLGWRSSNDLTQASMASWAAFPYLLGEYLNAEVGSVSYVAQGLGNGGEGGVPDLRGSWDHYYSGQSRLSGGLLTPSPDYIVCAMGSNENLVATPSVIVDLSVSWRAAAPGATLVTLVPYNRASYTQLVMGFNAWLADFPGDRAVLVAVGDEAVVGHESSITHYAWTGHSLYAALAAQSVTVQAAGQQGSTGSFNVVGNNFIRGR